MSFHEKSTAAMLAGIIIVYSWYFSKMRAVASTTHVEEGVVAIATIASLLAITVAMLVAIAIVAHIAIAIYEQTTTGDVDDTMDERDQLIELKSEHRSSTVLSVGVLAVLTLMLMNYSMFWTANALLGALVLSSITKCAFKLYYYRFKG
ncbi:hypothetical protein [Kordiimonas sp.]|uniref:hypothetical protein n=1 Tax=Kordiimonas sp. TaxID=1970157 RepID=UPI003A8E8AE0